MVWMVQIGPLGKCASTKHSAVKKTSLSICHLLVMVPSMLIWFSVEQIWQVTFMIIANLCKTDAHMTLCAMDQWQNKLRVQLLSISVPHILSVKRRRRPVLGKDHHQPPQFYTMWLAQTALLLFAREKKMMNALLVRCVELAWIAYTTLLKLTVKKLHMLISAEIQPCVTHHLLLWESPLKLDVAQLQIWWAWLPQLWLFIWPCDEDIITF